MIKELLESRITQIKIILTDEYQNVYDCAEKAIGAVENAIEDRISYEILPYSDFDDEIIFEINGRNLDTSKYIPIFKRIEDKYKCVYSVIFS